MRITDILARKGSRVVTIVESTTVPEAMSICSANRIGSLLVVEKMKIHSESFVHEKY